MLVKQAFVKEGGVFDEARQAALSRAEWQDIRSRINRSEGRNSAFCLGCNDPVYVKIGNSGRGPHFSHFAGGGGSCPWGPGIGLSPDQVRAMIFKGNQESLVHKEMCRRVLALIEKDPRFKPGSGAINAYERPAGGGRGGRWPDVRFELEGLGRFAIEVQFAESLATEVAERGKFYLDQGINLLWLLPRYRIDESWRAFVHDIAFEAGGNLFVLDPQAVAASEARRTLVLSTFWKRDGQLEHLPVTLDELTYRPGRHPYALDVVTPELFREASKRRDILEAGLRAGMTENHRRTKHTLRNPVTGDVDWQYEDLIRLLFSIWSEAKGEWFNYLNNHKDLQGVVSSYVYSRAGWPHARVVREMIMQTCARGSIKQSLLKMLDDAEAKAEQLLSDDPMISEAVSYFPEVFRSDLRGNPLRSDVLPLWAQ